MTNRETALKLWVVLSRANAAVAGHSQDDIARHQLSPTAFASMEALYHKGRMLVGELQRKILISSGGITYVIDQLEAKGLVTRRPCDEDRRLRFPFGGQTEHRVVHRGGFLLECADTSVAHPDDPAAILASVHRDAHARPSAP